MRNYISIMKLVALLVLVPIVIYVMSISDTIRLCKEYCQVKESVDIQPETVRSEELPASTPMLSSGVLMQMIADVISDSKVSVSHFSPEEVGREGTLRLVSARLGLTGNFVGLMKVLVRIEEVREIKIKESEFRTEKIGKGDKTVRLELTLVQVEDCGK